MATSTNEHVCVVPVYKMEPMTAEQALKYYLVNSNGPVNEDILNHFSGICKIIEGNTIGPCTFMATFAEAFKRLPKEQLFALHAMMSLATEFVLNQDGKAKAKCVSTVPKDDGAISIKKSWGDSVDDEEAEMEKEASGITDYLCTTALAQLIKGLSSDNDKFNDWKSNGKGQEQKIVVHSGKETYASIASKVVPVQVTTTKPRPQPQRHEAEEYNELKDDLETICDEFGLDFQTFYDLITQNYDYFTYSFVKTRPCTFHKEKRCTKGKNCTFAHSDAELKAFVNLHAKHAPNQPGY